MKPQYPGSSCPTTSGALLSLQQCWVSAQHILYIYVTRPQWVKPFEQLSIDTTHKVIFGILSSGRFNTLTENTGLRSISDSKLIGEIRLHDIALTVLGKKDKKNLRHWSTSSSDMSPHSSTPLQRLDFGMQGPLWHWKLPSTQPVTVNIEQDSCKVFREWTL